MNIHFISIGGSVMHQLAIALKRKGYRITGSDDEIFEPAKSNLLQEDILPKEVGWFTENIHSGLNAVILGMHAKGDNPELLKAKEFDLPVYSFPEYIFKESGNKLRVVVGGSHGKTTTTSMIMHVLREAGKDFDYLVGARLQGFDQSVNITNAPVIVCEGDEYPASVVEKRPKFHFLFPHIAVLTGIAWDHINVFPTFDFYLEQFVIFINKIETGGHLIYNETDDTLKELVEKNKREDIHYHPYNVLKHTISNGITKVTIDGEETELKVFGAHNLLNLHAAWLVTKQLGVDASFFTKAISSFTGAAKRLELMAKNESTVFYRDFAHAPSKVKATIEAAKAQFPEKKLTGVLELHTYSSLNEAFMKEYKGALAAADEAAVFYSKHALELKRMPELKKEDVQKGFGKQGLEVINERSHLETWLSERDFTNTIVLFMSSGNYDGFDAAAFAKKNYTNGSELIKAEQPKPLPLPPLSKAPNVTTEKPLAVLDIEATGSNVTTDRIVEIAIIKYLPDSTRTVKRKIINPQMPIPKAITEIHGITDEMVKEAPTFKQAANDIKQFLDGCDLSCYNAYRLDLPLLMEEFIRAEMEFELKNRKLIDVQKIFHTMEQRTLSAAYKFYCNKPLEDAHSAEADAAATAEILFAQVERYPQLGNSVDTIIKAVGEDNIIDFARRLAYDEKGAEVFNFGKHKGRPIADVLKAEPQYYDWMMKGEFPMNTKQKLTEIYTRIMLKKRLS